MTQHDAAAQACRSTWREGMGNVLVCEFEAPHEGPHERHTADGLMRWQSSTPLSTERLAALVAALKDTMLKLHGAAMWIRSHGDLAETVDYDGSGETGGDGLLDDISNAISRARAALEGRHE